MVKPVSKFLKIKAAWLTALKLLHGRTPGKKMGYGFLK
jgi:hypothetical protein